VDQEHRDENDQKTKMKEILNLCLLIAISSIASISIGLASCESQASNTRSETIGDNADPADSITLCSQNLFRFEAKIGNKKSMTQENFLVQRFIDAQCNLVAVQEVFGETKEQAQGNLNHIAVQLSSKARKKFTALVGETNDKTLRNGFIVDTTSLEILSQESFNKRPLRSLDPLSPPGHFSRGPFGVTIKLKHRNSSMSPKTLFALSFHLKSKANAYKDPTGYSFEPLRMEMAETLRRLAEEELKRNPDSIVAILGDMNSPPKSASSEILRGELTLADFRKGKCKLNSLLEATCDRKRNRRAKFKGLIYNKTKRKQLCGDATGTYKYRGKIELIDDITVPTSQLKIYTPPSLLGDFNKGSDHLLVRATFNL